HQRSVFEKVGSASKGRAASSTTKKPSSIRTCCSRSGSGAGASLSLLLLPSRQPEMSMMLKEKPATAPFFNAFILFIIFLQTQSRCCYYKLEGGVARQYGVKTLNCRKAKQLGQLGRAAVTGSVGAIASIWCRDERGRIAPAGPTNGETVLS